MAKGLIDLAADALVAETKRLTMPARLQLAQEVRTALAEFPEELLAHDDLLKVWRRRLLLLGGFRHIYLPPIEGHTTLYIGRDRQLYEYGPKRRGIFSNDNSNLAIARNPMAVRQLNIDSLDADDLLLCRALLHQIWLA